MSTDFTADQKRYLEGFMSGLQVARAGRGAPTGNAAARTEAVGPDAIHLKAQDAVIAAGGKLSDQEKVKRELHPFDGYDKLKAQAAANEAPKPADNFRWRYYGLFYVAPNQASYMCRLRMPNGILKHWQMGGLADLAENFGGGYSHVTTRANIQIREIEPKNAVNMVEGITDLGLCSRGSGADNIRNVTGTPTAGIDPRELLDTRPYAREWHYHILNERALYGLPRKFNVAFDGAGTIPVLEDTNDIGFQAVEVRDGFDVEPGIWFRLTLGGITGHMDFARDCGVIVRPQEATIVADAVVRVFIDHGDRTNRNKARLKYVLDRFGFEKFLVLMEEKLGRKLTRVPPEAVAPRPAFDRAAHIGVHAQQQAGLNWIGVVLPVGKLSCEQMRGVARLAVDLGDGDIRLTVWQNPAAGGIFWDSVLANVKPGPQETAVDYHNDARAPLLFISGGEDHLMPPSIQRSNAKHYKSGDRHRGEGVLRLRRTCCRPQQGWEEIADYALSWALSHARGAKAEAGGGAVKGVRLTHIGGPTVLIEVDGWRLLVDPTFDAPGRRYAFGWGTSSRKVTGPAVAAADLLPIDVVLLSHDHHADNLDDAGRALLPSAGLVVTTAPGAARLGGRRPRPAGLGDDGARRRPGDRRSR